MTTATMPDYGTVPRTSVEIHGVTFTRHPLSEKWPDMGRDQFAELVTDLDTHGQAQPVTMYQDAVLDGWHRIAALSILKVDPLLTEYNGNSAAEFVISLNARRRHLTIGQRVMAVMECIEWRNTGVNSGDANSTDTMTVAEAASLAGVSSRSVQRAKVIAKDDPEAAERVKTGESSLNEEHKQLRPPKAKAKTKAETSDDREPTENMTTCAARGCKALLRADDAVWFESDSYCPPCARAMDAEAESATTPVVAGEQATSKQNKNAIDNIVSSIVANHSAQDAITCLKCGDLVDTRNPATDDGLACATCNVTPDEAMESKVTPYLSPDNEDSFDEDANADCPKCESYRDNIDIQGTEIKRLRADLLVARSRIEELETALASR